MVRDLPREDLDNVRTIMLNMDPPQHSKYRKLVSQGFTPRMTAQLEPKIRKTTAEILDRVTPQGHCDFVRDIAAELPLIVIAELVGVPLEDRLWGVCRAMARNYLRNVASGVVLRASPPRDLRRSATSGDFSAAAVASLRRRTMSAGVAAGTSSPYQLPV